MKSPRNPLSIATLFVTCLTALVLVAGSAHAGGSVKFVKHNFKEANGGWNLMMMIDYGGKPSTPHQPVRFQFTPIMVYERFLDDAHGENPQTRAVSLAGQTPLFESVDVDFSDGRGKIFSRTKFDFTVTRDHNFSAGEYSVVVKRSDGGQIGGAQTVGLDGDNPVIDRRSMTFGSAKKKEAPKAAANNGLEAVPGDTASANKDKDKAAAGASSDQPAAAPSGAEAPPSEPAPPDSANVEKVPPSSKGCGCRVAGAPAGNGGLAAAGLIVVAAGVARSRRRAIRAVSRERRRASSSPFHVSRG